MVKYKVTRIRSKAEDTENMLNSLAQDGWRLVCSYACNNEWLILTKEK